MAMMAMGLGGDMTGYGLVGGGLRPSYFELFMQEFISSLLRPAMQHTVAALAPRIPLLYRASNWHDEIFTVILGLLEWTHLRTKGAPRAAPAPAPAPAPLAPASSSSARRPDAKTRGCRRRLCGELLRPEARAVLPALDERREAAAQLHAHLRPVGVHALPGRRAVPQGEDRVLGGAARRRGARSALLPRAPCGADRVGGLCEQQGAVADLGLGGDDDDSSEEEGEGAVASSGPRRGGVVAALRRGFIRAWPVINFSSEAVQFAYQFLYLVERTDWFSPGLQIFRLRILRLDDDDRGRLADIAANTPTWRRWLTRGMTGAALAGILTVKFFQWYYSAQADIPAKEKFIPPPPPPVEVRAKQISFAAPCL